MQRWQRETWRQGIAIVVGLLGLIVPGQPLLDFLAVWGLYALVYLALTWLAVWRGGMTVLVDMATSSMRLTRTEKWFASSPDGLAQTAASIAMVTVLLVMPRADEQGVVEPVVLGICLVAVVASWLTLQVGFLMTYVAEHRTNGGLAFPEDVEPGIVDYLYFTLSVGTTFGTTDVTVTRTPMRRRVMRHGVLAFLFNTLVLTVAITFTTNYLG